MAPEIIGSLSEGMDPEIIGSLSEGNTSSQPNYPFKIDVHSFAMLCYEILTGCVPFHDEKIPSRVKKSIKSGIRPELPNNCPPELKALIQECWDKIPKERPSFPDICSRLKYVKYLLMTGFCSSEDTQAPTKTQVAEDTPSSTKIQVAEDTQASTKFEVAEDTPASSKTQVAEDTQSSTKIEVAEDTQGSPLVGSEVIPGFSGLDGDLRSVLLNLIHVSDLASIKLLLGPDGVNCVVGVDEACRLLAIVQDRKLSDIHRFIFQLLELKRLNLHSRSDWRFGDRTPPLRLSNVRLHYKFLKEVLCKNPDFDIWLEVNKDLKSASFPNALVSLSLQRIRVLTLHECWVVECVDLSNFPALRLLSMIRYCSNLKAVKGWEVVKKLGWLDIYDCKYSVDFPRVQCLPSLREFRYDGKPDFTQCVRLRRLEICGSRTGGSLNSMDLSTLRFLEVLEIRQFSTLAIIEGLSGLHSLTKLVLDGCKALRGVPELGCLEALTHLDLRESGVKEIAGVQELHLLTSLRLSFCRSLKRLPCLSHLKALAYLDIRWSGVEEILGVEDLDSLETFECQGSSLKRLPDLCHLRRLRRVVALH